MNNVTIPMTLGAGYAVDIYKVYTGPLVEILTGTLTSLNDTMIPETITVLRDYTFYNNENLTEVSLQHVTEIGASCFNACAVTSLSMPVLTTAGMQAFAYNPIVTVTLPALQTIGTRMFQHCEDMTVADFPSVTTIMRQALYDCTAFETLILRANQVVELEGTQHFYNTKIESGTGYIYVPDSLVDTYKADESWASYANQIRAISELEVE